jgi:2-polyprenyl-6-methoxyphenol hydroxylase-like FAD-dependent oxidoreductase
MRSAVAAAVRAPLLVNDPPKTCVYYGFYPGAAAHAELYARPRSWVSALPTNDGLSLVQAYWPQQEYPRVRADVPGSFAAAVRAASPDLWDRMAAAGRVDRFYGTGDQRNFFRTAAGPGWALVGDAGHHSDAITAHGITHAFLQAQLLADHLPADLAHESALRTALDLYATERDPLLRADYANTLATAELLAPATVCEASASVC